MAGGPYWVEGRDGGGPYCVEGRDGGGPYWVEGREGGGPYWVEGREGGGPYWVEGRDGGGPYWVEGRDGGGPYWFDGGGGPYELEGPFPDGGKYPPDGNGAVNEGKVRHKNDLWRYASVWFFRRRAHTYLHASPVRRPAPWRRSTAKRRLAAG